MKQKWYCGKCMKEYNEEVDALKCCYEWKVKVGTIEKHPSFTKQELNILYSALHAKNIELLKNEHDNTKVKALMLKIRIYTD